MSGEALWSLDGLRSVMGMTASDLRKVRAAARSGEIEAVRLGKGKKETLYRLADVLRVLDLHAAPDEEEDEA